jgi:cytochrome P450
MSDETRLLQSALDPDPEDPHPGWAEQRRECPVRTFSGLGRTAAQVFTFAAAEGVLRDPETFSSSINQDTIGPYMGTVMLAMDGAEHTRYRNLVSHAFRASALSRWERELIRPEIHGLLDAIEGQGRAELVRDVTSRYPVKVIAGIVGVPLEDHDRFQTWAEEIAQGPGDPERGHAASKAMREYLAPFVADRRRNPRDDLISDIVSAEIDGVRLDDEHVYGFLRLLMPAGAETTYRLMGSCLLALLTHPESLARVRADASLLPAAIEETLRWDTSINMVNRVATRDAEVAGIKCPAGTSMLMMLGAANRDETRFERPDEWDLDREPQTHLAFGWGRHLCLGMHLARLELEIGIGAVLERLPGLRLDPSEPTPDVVGVAFRGPQRLPVLFDSADGAHSTHSADSTD